MRADASTPPKTGHLRRGPGLVKEDQPLDVLAHARLAGCRPFMPRFLHIGALGFAGLERFPAFAGTSFLNEKPAWIRTRDKDA